MIRLLLGLLLVQSAVAEDYLLCHRDPTIYKITPRFDTGSECNGSVKLQGIAYKCGKMAEVSDLSRRFLNELVINGRKECQEICASRGKGCVGVFTAPEHCAIKTTPQKAQEFGMTQAKCAPYCEGQAFIHCSIYHASFLRADEELFTKKQPNCYCRKNSVK